MSHVHVANQLFADSKVNTFLLLEDDYELVPPSHGGVPFQHAAAPNIARFLSTKNKSWGFLRLGYNPRWPEHQNDTSCRAACTCEVVSKGICSIRANRHSANESCWVGSTVGYAVHRRAWQALQMLGDCTLEAGVKNFDRAIDLWMGGYSERCRNTFPVHYVVPGILHQRVDPAKPIKNAHVPAMANFSSKCVKPTPRHAYQPRSTTFGFMGHERNSPMYTSAFKNSSVISSAHRRDRPSFAAFAFSSNLGK